MEELALVQPVGLALMRTVVTIKHMTMLSALCCVVMSQIEKKKVGSAAFFQSVLHLNADRPAA